MSFQLPASLQLFVSSAPLSRLNSACFSSLRSPHYSRSSIDQTWRRGWYLGGGGRHLGEENRRKKRRNRVSARSWRDASFFLLLILFLPVSSCPLLGPVLTRETRHRPSHTTVTSPIRFRWLHFHLGSTSEIIICFPPPPFFTGRFHVFFYIFLQFSVAYEHSYGSYRVEGREGWRGCAAAATRPRRRPRPRPIAESHWSSTFGASFE